MGIQHRNLNFPLDINSQRKRSEEASFKKQYVLGEKLGDGAGGTVYRCTRILDNKEFAVKIISSQYDYNDELLFLKQLNKNKYVTQLVDCFEGPKYTYIIIELCNYGDLLKYINEGAFNSERRAKNVFRQIVEAVHSLHESGIVHRDLKPENILVVRNNIKICDFGLSFRKGIKTNKNVGTPVFKAPEMLKNEYYNHKIDWWACGVILYVMILVDFPFATPEDGINYGVVEPERKKHLQKIHIKYGMIKKRGNYKYLPNDVKDLISNLLKVDPNKRYDYQDIIKHPWMNNNI